MDGMNRKAGKQRKANLNCSVLFGWADGHSDGQQTSFVYLFIYNFRALVNLKHQFCQFLCHRLVTILWTLPG